MSTQHIQADSDLTLRPMAYLLLDERRDIEAMQLVKHKQISAPDPQRVGFAFTCYSSTATQYDNDAKMQYHTASLLVFMASVSVTALTFKGVEGLANTFRQPSLV